MNEKKMNNGAKKIVPHNAYWANKKKLLGLDLGIASIGWCLYEEDDVRQPKRIIDIGSFVFDQIENGDDGKTENIARRTKRGIRRQRRRRVLRLEDARKLFKEKLGVDLLDTISKRKTNETPFDLKVKGLSEPLTKEELSIALYHYLKHRGFKSNRKHDDQKASGDDKKLLGEIQKKKDRLSNSLQDSGEKLYVTQLLKKDFEEATGKDKRYRNDDEVIKRMAVDNAMYREEICALLDKQREFGVIKGDFKDAFLKIYDRRRDYSEGPGGNSPYRRASFAEAAGVCCFDNKLRACKDSYSAQMFVLLSALNNFRYKLNPEDDYHSLTKEQISKAADALILKKGVKYPTLFKALGFKEVYRVKGVELTRKQFTSVQKQINEKSHQEKWNNDKTVEELNLALKKTTFDQVFFKGSDLITSLTEELKKAGLNLRINDETFYNSVAEILFECKTDNKIQESCKEHGLTDEETAIILNLDGASQTIELSVDLCQKLVPLMKEGNTYDKAMKLLGFDHSKGKKADSIGYMPEINDALERMNVYLTNPVVKHALVQLRRLLNAIVREYGAPDDYSIELARELKRNFDDRKAIKDQQKDNQRYNIQLKTEMLEKYPHVFRTFRDINAKGGQGDNLLKYKLFIEQDGVSPYTNRPIDETKLFDKNYYQIDHIAPYSQSFNDSFDNKVLVETEENQKKKNRLPLEYLGNNRGSLDAFLRTHHRISLTKRNLLLSKQISEDFVNKDASDNSYIAVLAKKLIELYMLPEGVNCRTNSGAITSKLRNFWGLSGKTHSYLSSYEQGYQAKFIEQYVYNKFEFVVNEENKKEELLFAFNYGTTEKHFSLQKATPKSKRASKKPQKPSGETKTEEAKDDLSEQQKLLNKAFDLFKDNQSYFYEVFSGKTTINDLEESLSGCRRDVNGKTSERYNDGLLILAYVRNCIQEDINEKNRENHLHHALDAAIIGATTPSMIQKLTKFYQSKEEEVNLETGEINEKIVIPFPYKEFRKEVLSRVYERDTNKLLSILNTLDNYNECPATIKNTHVLVPARIAKKDVVGAVSKETIFGVKKKNGEEILTKKISVLKLKRSDCDSIVDRDKGNKAVYEACLVWFDEGKKTEYPVLKKKGNLIRFVKLEKGKPSQKVDLSRGRYAENINNIRVNVYKKKGDDVTLYFSPIYYYQLSRRKIHDDQIRRGVPLEKAVSLPNVTLMWAQGSNGSVQLPFDEVQKYYELIASLPRQSFIEVTKKDGNSCNVYSAGCTSGVFEVYSPLGDGYDLINPNSRLFTSLRSGQYTLTVSTIRNIKVRSISVLGKIS